MKSIILCGFAGILFAGNQEYFPINGSEEDMNISLKTLGPLFQKGMVHSVGYTLTINGSRYFTKEEKWVRWEPIQGLANKYFVDSIASTIEEGFVILLSEYQNPQNKVKVVFKNSVDCYSETNESYRLKTMDELSKKYGSGFYGDWTFFKIEDSSFIQWLSEQSCGISDERSFTHFCFVAGDSFLDVITNYEPEVELITDVESV